MKKILILAAIVLFVITNFSFADSIYGTCKRSDGSKVNKSVKISTSWNSKKSFPSNGEYVLDFGGSVDKRITVYVDGQKYTTVYVDGDVRLDIIAD